MSRKIESTPEAWEAGELGANEKSVKVSSKETQLKLDEKLGMKAISIRLPIELIEDFKFIAEYNDIGYQPLIRKLLHRFRDAEMKEIAVALYKRQKADLSDIETDDDDPDTDGDSLKKAAM